MMKRTAILSLALTALAACGSSSSPDAGTASAGTTGAGTTSGGSSSGGSTGGGASCGPAPTTGNINLVLTSVGVHPAAIAALAALNITPPPLTSGYHVALQAVSLKTGSPFLSDLGSVELTSSNATGPVEFDNVSFAGGISSLGVISAIVADPLPDGGTPVAPAPPTCAQLIAGTGFTDYYVTAASQVYFGTPTKDICDGVVFALPASYVALLDCAAGIDPTSSTDLLGSGFALLYASASASAAGAALSGVTFDDTSANILYYPTGYGAGLASATAPSTATGIATVTGVTGIGTVSATDTAGDKFSSRDLATTAGAAYMVFYAPGT